MFPSDYCGAARELYYQLQPSGLTTIPFARVLLPPLSLDEGVEHGLIEEQRRVVFSYIIVPTIISDRVLLYTHLEW